MNKLALTGGKIYVRRDVFAQALYAEDGVIRAVGTDEEIRALCGDAEVIDCGGKTVIPGINDSHMHLLMTGESMLQVNIADSTSVEDMVERVQRFLREHPERCVHGIHSVGWNQDLFTSDKRLPTKDDLDSISTDIPIVLERICGHIITVNSKVIEMLGLTRDSPQYPGGTWEKDENGEPNGQLTELACGKAVSLFPPVSDEECEQMFLSSAEYALSRGITSVQSNDCGTMNSLPMENIFRVIRKIYAENRCALRYRHQIAFPSTEAFRAWLENNPEQYLCDNPRLTLGPLKLFKDGSLGARTATMKHEYLDDPGNYGVEATSAEEMNAFCRIADEHNMQVVTHVIGDKAIEDTVKSYETVLHDGKNPLRHGLIHCQITDLPLLERIAKDQIPAFYQPIFLDYDMHAVISRCGEQLSSTSYAFRTLEELGAPVSYGTDSPVEDCNPFPNLYSAVTRKDKTGFPDGGFFPQECVDVPAAIDAYTAGSAFAEFREQDKGRLQPGFLADMVILDRDIFTCDPDDIRNIQPVMTIVGGEIAWQK